MKRELTLEQALDESISRLQAGDSPEACLARYPQFADELRPLLETAMFAGQMEVPAAPASAVERSRARMFAAVDRKFAKQSKSAPVSESLLARYTGQLITWITGKENPDMKLITRFAFAAIAVAVFIVVGSGVTMASASALPGDTFYPAKLALEKLRLTLVLQPEAREELEWQIQNTRREEVQELIQIGREAKVHFIGELLAFDDASWNVGGISVQVSSETVIIGDPAVGVQVSVAATVQADGTLRADKLTVLDTIPQNGGNPYPGPDTPTAMPTEGHNLTKTPYTTQGATHEPTFEPPHTPLPTHVPTDEPPHTPPPTHEPTHEPPHTPPPTHAPTVEPTHELPPPPQPTEHGGDWHHPTVTLHP